VARPSWPFDLTVYAGLALLAAGYPLLALGRLDSRARAGWFTAGLITLWVALETPIDTIGDQFLQSVHMLQHVLLGVVAPPLLLLGLSPAMSSWLIRRVPGLRLVAEPVPAQVAAAAVMIAWHLPVLYDLTLRSEAVHVFEHFTFIVAGVLFWWPVLEATAPSLHARLGDGWKLLYLLVGTLPQDGVSLALIFARVPFYDFYTHVPRLIPEIDPVIDQNLSGVLLFVAGKTSYAVAMLVIFFRWLAHDRATEHLPVSPVRGR
jgi:putative membrane protein